ncbi:hypothetical protein HUW51_17480 [Adhaeribacter swui]|uniref:Uncharacterized protein n=1 Tax=Adhaeribacter swui TaxID=2086471 RepID=A0A7G7GB93_9BACT|nr:hypothetical protein [Adhaeribacter swui]QNF34427.1 hypothetical protein HUW51_17480 [Adhaeribacter swui]
MKQVRLIFLIYCGSCVALGVLIFMDHYLPKDKVVTKVEGTKKENSQTNIKVPSARTNNYFIRIDSKDISVDGTTYGELNEGDGVTVLRTFVLRRIFALESKEAGRLVRLPYSSLYYAFPLIPILLLIPLANFFVGKNKFLKDFFEPLSLIVPLAILFFDL